MAAPAPFVWVQLYYEGKEEPVGQVVLIKPVPDFVTELAKAVKVEKPNALSHCDASDLYVYSPGTKPASEEKKCIRPGMNLQKLIAEYKSKQTPPTSDEFPLIVVAPNKKATPDSDTTSRTDLDDILQFVRQQKEQSETLAISNATKHRFQDVLDQFEIRVDTPTWDNPPEISDSSLPPPYNWLSSKEDSKENRQGYMAYLKQHVVLPANTTFFDGNNDGNLLGVRFADFALKLSGNVDVAVAGRQHQSLTAVRQNMLGAFELKKDSNKQDAMIDRQVILQHMAASYLNPTTGILTLMTDLNTRWFFYWFDGGDGGDAKLLMRYEARPSHALFLIKHMIDPEGNLSAPVGFFSRASWYELFPRTIHEKIGPSVPAHFDDSDHNDNEEDHSRHGPGRKAPAARSDSRPPEQGTRFECSGTQQGTEDECLDFMDKEEELAEVLKYAMKTSFHRIFSRYDTESDKAGSLPPSQISF